MFNSQSVFFSLSEPVGSAILSAAMSVESKVNTRNKAAKAVGEASEQCASLQSLDDKLNAVLNILQQNTDQIKDIKSEQRELGNSLEMCHNSISDLKMLVQKQDTKINSCENSIQDVKKEHLVLGNKVKLLQTEINSVEQYSHRNNLLIYGIPEVNGENIILVVKRLAEVLNFENWSIQYIDAVHRMGRRGGPGPRPIIIKFVSRLVKEQFLKLRRLKRNLKASDLGYSSDDNIYVNESLTSSTRQLLKLARETAKQRKYDQVWTANCAIFVRKDRDSPSIKILSAQDLDKM